MENKKQGKQKIRKRNTNSQSTSNSNIQFTDFKNIGNTIKNKPCL